MGEVVGRGGEAVAAGGASGIESEVGDAISREDYYAVELQVDSTFEVPSGGFCRVASACAGRQNDAGLGEKVKAGALAFSVDEPRGTQYQGGGELEADGVVVAGLEFIFPPVAELLDFAGGADVGLYAYMLDGKIGCAQVNLVAVGVKSGTEIRLPVRHVAVDMQRLRRCSCSNGEAQR